MDEYHSNPASDDWPWTPPTAPDYGSPYGPKPAAGPKGGRRRSRVGAGLAALLVAGALVGAGVSHALWHEAGSSTTTASVTSPVTRLPSRTVPSTTAPSTAAPSTGSTGSGSGSSGSSAAGSTGAATATLDPAAVAAQADAGIVDVQTVLGYQGGEGAGTGIVLSADGLILTNNHVIEGATRIRVVSVTSGETWTADVVGYSASKDVALLKLRNASGLTPATLGTSAALAVGEQVVGVGNGGGTGGTPSWVAGAVTALGQSITATNDSGGNPETLAGLVQTNLAIVPGYSGGPLLDAAGAVVGIDTAASSANSAAQTAYGRRGAATTATPQAYAVGIDDALAVVQQIEKGQAGSTVHVGGTALLGVSVSAQQTSGALVAGLLQGGPSEAAGIVAGDAIVAVDGQSVASAPALSAIMQTLTPGHAVAVVVQHADGTQQSFQVAPVAGPPA